MKENILPILKPVLSEKNQDSNRIESQIDLFSKLVFQNSVVLMFGIDMNTHFELLKQDDFPNDIDIESLEEIVTNNLFNEIVGDIRIHRKENGVIGFTCGGDFEATLVLLSITWEVVFEELETEDIHFAIPTKDIVMFTRSDNESGINHLRKVLSQIKNDEEGFISNKIYKLGDKVEIVD